MLEFVELAEIIRNRRKARGLSQAALSKLSGVSRARIAGLETNHLPEIGLKTTLRLLAALDLDLQIIPHARARPTLDDLRREHDE